MVEDRTSVLALNYLRRMAARLPRTITDLELCLQAELDLAVPDIRSLREDLHQARAAAVGLEGALRRARRAIPAPPPSDP